MANKSRHVQLNVSCGLTNVKNLAFSPVTIRITRHHIVSALAGQKKSVANVYQRLCFTGEIRSTGEHLLFKKTKKF